MRFVRSPFDSPPPCPRDYDIEIEGLKRETMRAQEEHEGLIAVRDRLESGRVFVEEQLAKTKVGGGGRVYGVNIPSILASGVIFLVHLHYDVFAKTKVGGGGGLHGVFILSIPASGVTCRLT